MSYGEVRIIDQNTDEVLATLPSTFSIHDSIECYKRAGYNVRWDWAKYSPTDETTDDCLYRGQAYFAQDGSYGEADDILVGDTTQWVGDDWDEVIEAADMHRLEAAQEIHKRYLTLGQKYVTMDTSGNNATLTKGN